jgi:hypothetical protein
MAAGEMVARARAVVASVAESFGMEPSEIDLEGMRRSARDEGSEYRPVAIFRNTYRSSVRDSGRIILVLEEHRDEDRVIVIIRDLRQDDATEFTEAIEQEIVKRLTAESGSENVRVQRGKVGRSLYAP